MNIALILAGGSGTRMLNETPKQFIHVNGRPLLDFTIERFQLHPKIDSITIVCLHGWESYVKVLCSDREYDKVNSIVTGGRSAIESIKKGIETLSCEDEDVIVIHDGVRPLVDEASIDAVIRDCKQYGGAISAVPSLEHMVYQGDSRTDIHYIPREKTFKTITPQAYLYSNIIDAFRTMETTGAGRDAAFIGTLMMDIGLPVCLSPGSSTNIKITMPGDLELFSILLHEKA